MTTPKPNTRPYEHHLDRDIEATLIHGVTGRKVETQTLEKGTTIKVEEVRLSPEGLTVATVLAFDPKSGDWYRYEVADSKRRCRNQQLLRGWRALPEPGDFEGLESMAPDADWQVMLSERRIVGEGREALIWVDSSPGYPISWAYTLRIDATDEVWDTGKLETVEDLEKVCAWVVAA